MDQLQIGAFNFVFEGGKRDNGKFGYEFLNNVVIINIILQL